MVGGPEAARQERRVVTAMFADMVGSTTLIERLDPEDAYELLGGAIELMIREVDALGGTVKDLAGDGILAIFGAPTAHEDDAERAVLCGLRIADAIAEYSSSPAAPEEARGLSVRIGVESGRVVTGPVGGGSRVEYGATGDALNTAARLQSLAEPGAVLVGAAARAMSRDSFDWGENRSFTLKGKDVPVVAAVALAFTPRPPTQSDASYVQLVGRDAEVDQLREVKARLDDGLGSVVVVVGDAGAGKTRLVAELNDMLRESPPGLLLEAAAASHSTNIPFDTYRRLLVRWLDLPDSATPTAIRSAMVRRARSSQREIGQAIRTLLRALTSAGHEGGDPEAARQRIFNAIRDLAEALAEGSPIVVVLEDLQWMDPTSAMLTESLVDSTGECPLVLVITARPEGEALAYVSRFTEHAGDHTVRIDLRPMSRDEDRALMHELLRGTEIPRRFEDALLDTTDGNPFFVYEQVRALQSSGALAETASGDRRSGDVMVDIAPTIERALMARIDHLEDSEKHTLLAASVLGQQFDGFLVDHVTGADATASLARLVDAEFITHVAGSDAAWSRFEFQHALVRQAAYASLVKRDRQALHLRAAEALEESYAGRVDEISATLGRHLAEGGDASGAIPFLLQASRSAAITFSNQEAASLATEALQLVGDLSSDTISSTEETRELLHIAGTAQRHQALYTDALATYRQLFSVLPPAEPLQQARTAALIGQLLTLDHRYEEALHELGVAERLCDGPPWDQDSFAVWLKIQMERGDTLYWLRDTRYTEALKRIEPIVNERATPQQKLDFQSQVRQSLWRRHLWVITEETLRVDREVFLAAAAHDDEEVRAWAPFLHGFTLMWHRDLDEAQAFIEESLAASARIGSTLLQARCLTYLMITARLRRDVDAARNLLEPVRESARQGGLQEYEAMAAATAAWVAYRNNDATSVLEEGQSAMAIGSALPFRFPFDWMYCLPMLAVAMEQHDLANAGRWAQAMLSNTQQPLPGPIAENLAEGLQAIASDERSSAALRFQTAVVEATRLGYL